MMKKKKFKKFKLKINFKTIQPLILLTLIFTMLGLSFGKLLDNFLVPTQGPTATVGGPNDQPQELEKSKDVEAEEGQSDASESTTAENEIYVMQLGVYETYDNVLSLAGELKQLGYNYGILKVDGEYSVFSHVSGTKESLAPVQEALKEKQIDCFIKAVEVSTDDLKWNYFLQAVKQKPFEMTGDFIQTFTDEEMHIWGYYVTLSTASFDALSTERQKMLLEIYQWLNG